MESHDLTSNLSDSFVVENTVSFVQKTDSARLRGSPVQGMARYVWLAPAALTVHGMFHGMFVY